MTDVVSMDRKDGEDRDGEQNKSFHLHSDNWWLQSKKRAALHWIQVQSSHPLWTVGCCEIQGCAVSTFWWTTHYHFTSGLWVSLTPPRDGGLKCASSASVYLPLNKLHIFCVKLYGRGLKLLVSSLCLSFGLRPRPHLCLALFSFSGTLSPSAPPQFLAVALLAVSPICFHSLGQDSPLCSSDTFSHRAAQCN